MGRGDHPALVGDRLGVEAINMNLLANTKASVLRELVNLAERTGLLYDKQGLLAAIQERESMCSTGLPNGMAIPHPRQPMPYATAEPLLCIARVQKGIPFDAMDGVLTDLFVLICSHEHRPHLQVLARLMRIFDSAMLSALRATEDPEEVLQLVLAKEQAILSRQQKPR
jgi:PTS system nitrogen regulatory IIA component